MCVCVGVLASPRIIVLNSLMISIRPSAERGSSSVFVVVVVACGCVVVVLAENDKYYDELLSGGCAATAAADTIAADRMICDDMRVDARVQGVGGKGAFVAIAVSYIRLCAHGNGIGNGGRASHRTSASMEEHDLCVDNTGGGCGSLVLWRASVN